MPRAFAVCPCPEGRPPSPPLGPGYLPGSSPSGLGGGGVEEGRAAGDWLRRAGKRRPAAWLGVMARVLLNQKSCAPWMRKVPVLF